MGQRPTQLILKRLNYVLKDIIPSKLQMSLNVLLIQPDRIEFSSASMPPVLIYHKDKNKIEEFSTGDFPLGYMEETSYHSNTVPFVSGDVIVMFTSSYPDTTNLSNEPLGFEAIEKMVQENVHLSAKELLDKLVHLSKWYSQNKKLVDDVAIMVIKHL